MRYSIFKKYLLIIVLVLLIGSAFTPITIGEEKNICKIQNIDRFDWWNTEWEYRRVIIINHNMVEGDLANFPVLISITSYDFTAHAQSDGDDFVFTSEDHNIKYSHEIESYDSSSGELIAWVRIPFLDGDADTIIYLYYGNPNCASQEESDDVWDYDFIHVWHLGFSLKDSAGINSGSNYGTDVVTGKVGKARDFNQSENDYITFGDMYQPGDGYLTTMTWEGWVKPQVLKCIIMTKYNSQGIDYSSYYIDFNNVGEFRALASSSFGVKTESITDDVYASMNEWVYLVATFNLGGTNDIVPFVNGNEVSDYQPYSNGDYMRDIPVSDDLGRYRPEQGTEYTDAVIDEVRWSKVIRSNAWIKTSFNTMYDPSSFFSVGSEEELNLPPSAPSINGPVTGNAGTTYSYTFVSEDPEGYDLFYQIDWGDGTFDDWFGPYASNDLITKEHSWKNQGNYTIKARAKDEFDIIGEWGTLVVTMPRINSYNDHLFLWFFERFQNSFLILRQILGFL